MFTKFINWPKRSWHIDVINVVLDVLVMVKGQRTSSAGSQTT